MPEPDHATSAVVALKTGPQAKSRLGGLPDPLRRRIAWTMAVDTLAVLAAVVDEVWVVSHQPALKSTLHRLGVPATVLPETGVPSLNGALRQGAERARQGGARKVLACVGDLPALTELALRAVLTRSSEPGRWFLSDTQGTGTTMLLAQDTDLDPHFGGRSAAAHRVSGAVAITADGLASARRDVDTEVDLADAVRLGLGPRTAALFDPSSQQLGTYQVVTTTSWSDADGTPLVVSSAGHRLRCPSTAFTDGFRPVRLGQRLHAATAEGWVLSAWL